MCGLILACEDSGIKFDHSFPACPHPHLFFFFFKVEISSRTLSLLFMPGLVTTSYNLSSGLRNCPSSRLPASWKLRLLLIRVQCNNNNNNKLAGMQTTPTFRCGGHAAAAGIAPWCEGKKSATLPHAVPLPHRTTGIRHSYFLCSRVLPSPPPLPHDIRTACMDSQQGTDNQNPYRLSPDLHNPASVSFS